MGREKSLFQRTAGEKNVSLQVQSRRILFLTHGGSTIGGGHISRCFALAEAFEEMGVSVFWLVNPEGAVLLREKGVGADSIAEIEDPFSSSLERIMSTVEQFSPSLCLIDSYAHTLDLLAALRKKCLLAIIDDERRRPVEEECDFVLNYNLGAEKIGYIPRRAEFLLGPRYTLLRRGFRDITPEEGESILILLGASDPLNAGEEFVQWWKEEWPPAGLVLGPLVKRERVDSLMSAAKIKNNFTVLFNPPTLPVLMAGARAVICTSSVTSYEALALGKPLTVFQVAQNQVLIGREIAMQNLGKNLGYWGTWGQPELEGALSFSSFKPQRRAVNARGAIEAAAALLKSLH